jgi:exonuclease III
MRIIEWNCQGAFRKKNNKILALKPDILIVPECESKQILKFETLTPMPSDFFWYSDSGNKGIGIFSYSDYKFELLQEFNPKFRYIIPLRVSDSNSSFLLFAVWAMDNKEKSNESYIGQVWLAMNYYSHILDFDSIIIGDFNSNQIWDAKERVGNHSAVVEFLNKHNIISLYHKKNKVNHGQEKEYTFFLYRKLKRPYHIDYTFISKNLITNNCNIKLGNPTDWIELSDHIPMIVDIEKPIKQLSFKSSFSDFISAKIFQCNQLTIEKFTQIIDKLRNKAINCETENEKILIINALENLLEIDKRINELAKHNLE